jgi:hypothetical protein
VKFKENIEFEDNENKIAVLKKSFTSQSNSNLFPINISEQQHLFQLKQQ